MRGSTDALPALSLWAWVAMSKQAVTGRSLGGRRAGKEAGSLGRQGPLEETGRGGEGDIMARKLWQENTRFGGGLSSSLRAVRPACPASQHGREKFSLLYVKTWRRPSRVEKNLLPSGTGNSLEKEKEEKLFL